MLIINLFNYYKMKNKFFLTLIALFIVITSCDKETIITNNKLPDNTTSFLNTHFSGINVGTAIKDKDGLTITYKVYLMNGFEIEFDKSGEWDDVDCKYSAIPNSILNLIPQQIISYCESNFPSNFIVEIDKERYGYEIALSNDIDVEFNTDGSFRRID